MYRQPSSRGDGDKMSLWAESLARRILGLPEVEQARMPCEVNEAAEYARRLMDIPPWYAVRRPLEPYEWPELRQAARVLRRAIRRNLHTLLTDPQSPMSLAIQEAMINKPERPKLRAMYASLRQLLDVKTIQIRPEVVEQWIKDCGLRVEKDLDTSIWRMFVFTN
jgi:hypothetical protein